MMIFNKFPDNKRALNFMRCVERSYGRKAQLFHSQEQSNKVDPSPFELIPPIVLVERRDDCSGEDEITALVNNYGGEFAGT